MTGPEARCVLLADRHHGLTEGLRGLLETLFDNVVMVADEHSLHETAMRLQPTVVVVDLSLGAGQNLAWLRRLRDRCAASRIVLLSVYDEPSVTRTALAAGADAVVLKRDIVTHLLPTVEAMLAGTPIPEPTPPTSSTPG